jgi:hypothetical protein
MTDTIERWLLCIFAFFMGIMLGMMTAYILSLPWHQ